MLISDKKFNVILYSVDECPSGSTWSIRQESDLASMVSVLSSLDSSFQSQSIKDYYRLGKFDPSRGKPRPILVKFIRMRDASSILSKKGKLRQPYYNKADMTREQRERESILTKERWGLIQSGVLHSQIRIRNTAIYVKNKLHGKVVDSVLERAKDIASLSDSNAQQRVNSEHPPSIVRPNHSNPNPQLPSSPAAADTLPSTKPLSPVSLSPPSLPGSTIATAESEPDSSKATNATD